MWDRYASNWAGLAIGYDIDPLEVKCKCEGTNTCNERMPFTLAPILYEDRFDMSSLSAVLMGSCKLFPYLTFDVYLALVHATIHKDPKWAHEREWRLFSGTCDLHNGTIYAQLKPAEIIIGYKTCDDDVATTKTICDHYDIPLRKIVFDPSTPGYGYCFDQLQ